MAKKLYAVPISVTEETKKAIKKLAQKDGRTIYKMAEIILEKYLDDEFSQTIKEFNEDGE